MKNLLLHIFDNDQREKKMLIQQMKSKDNSVAINAVNTLRKKRDEARTHASNVFSSVSAGSWTNLTGEDFSEANLKGADISDVSFILKNANLTHAILVEANLQDTILDKAILDSADLSEANMQEVHLLGAQLRKAVLKKACMYMAHLHAADFSFAKLMETDLHSAKMKEANFQGADLTHAIITHANFKNANLENANFKNVTWYQKECGRIKYNVKLPDESIMKDISDLNRFTDPYHPEFWRPNCPVAWGGKNGILKREDISTLDLRQNDDY